MTFTRVYLSRITCDECGYDEEIMTNEDMGESLEENEYYLFEDLKANGWVYIQEKDKHYCLECAKALNISSTVPP